MNKNIGKVLKLIHTIEESNDIEKTLEQAKETLESIPLRMLDELQDILEDNVNWERLKSWRLNNKRS